jgi:hypothetical protein
LSCVVAVSAPARQAAFGVAETRACLTRHGAVFGSAVEPAIAALPAAQRRKVLAGVLPPGTTNLVLVIGISAADAVALRQRLAAKAEFRPTAANSRSGQSGNAAWFVESLGGRPSLASSTLVKNCLRTGSTPMAPPPLTLAAASSCLGTHSADVLSRRARSQIFPPIPATIEPYLLVALVPGDNSGTGQGVFGFILVGGTLRESLTLRAELVKALAGHLAGEVTGQGRAAAWLTVPTRRASSRQVATARRVFNDCVA